MAVEFDGAGKPLKYNGVTNPPPNIFVTWNSAANPSTFTLNLGDLNTADGITCNAGPYSETLVTQDGNGPGQLTGIAMSEEGLVSAIFSNGQTLNIFLVPLANFAAPHKLSPGNGNVWTQTNASGSFLLATAKSAGMGSIMANSLEQSTVELAQQLTKMMEVERFYSSNVQVIKADENMFNDLKQLSR
jgi:flagellar hook protein FlgE